jgi:hypothetical protein
MNRDRSIQGPPDCQELGLAYPWAHSSCPCQSPIQAPIRASSGFIPARLVPLASRSERVIRPAKCEACVQHDKRDDNDRSLIDSDGNYRHTGPMPCCPLFRPVSNYLITFGYPPASIIAKVLDVPPIACQ